MFHPLKNLKQLYESLKKKKKSKALFYDLPFYGIGASHDRSERDITVIYFLQDQILTKTAARRSYLFLIDVT